MRIDRTLARPTSGRYRDGRGGVRARAHRRPGRQRRGQDQPARGRRLPGARSASFRGAPTEALVRAGCRRRRWCGPRATDDGRDAAGRGRDRPTGPQPGAGQPAAPAPTRRTCSARCRVTVFAPDDLELVKGGPAVRRELPRRPARRAAPAQRRDCAPSSSEVLRQRNALLKQLGGRLDAEAARTLDVWDAQARRRSASSSATLAGDAGRAARPGRGRRLRRAVGRRRAEVAAALRRAVARARAWPRRWPRRDATTLRRGVTLVGPASRRRSS